MNATEVLSELKRQHIHISVDGENLNIVHLKDNVISPDILEKIRANKQHIIDSLSGNTNNEIPPLRPTDRPKEIPLSFAQQRLWIINQLEENDISYNLPWGFRLQGNLDITALQRAFQTIVDRHESLRTTFKTVDGKAVQVISDSLTLDFPLIRVSEEEVSAYAKNISTHVFDFATGPLIKLCLLKLGKQTHILLANVHHIVFDGWSGGILIKELTALYNAYKKGEASPLLPPSIQYADFAIWQRDWLRDDVLEQHTSYWKQQLDNAPPLSSFPTDYPRPAKQDPQGAVYKFTLSKELTSQLNTLARQERATLFMLLMAAFQVLLARHSGQDDICVGTPVANRKHPALSDVIGFFVNTLVIRTQIDENLSFKELLQQVKATALSAYRHQDLPFERVVEALSPERSMSYSPLFQVALALQNASNETLTLGDIDVFPADIDMQASPFDLSLDLTETDNGLNGLVFYRTSLFKADTVQRILTHFQTLLGGIVNNPGQPIHRISLLDEQELHTLLHTWNQTDAPYPENQTVHQLFEEQVERTPHHIALAYEGEELTYRTVNEKANQLAHLIRECYTQQHQSPMPSGTLIALYQNRSIDMVISMLAVLKAGGAYVPISPEYPEERIVFMLEDTQAPLILTVQSHLHILEKYQSKLTKTSELLAVDFHEFTETLPTANLELESTATDLAYIIYTSGTTGKPKGVLTPHRGIASFIINNNYIDLSHKDVLLHLSNPNFDATTFEVWGALLHGAKLVVVGNEQGVSVERMEALLENNKVTVLFVTKALFDNLYVQQPNLFNSLRYLLTGGEALTPDLVKKLVAQKERPKYLLNCYGPTESTTFTTTYECASFSGSVPLGKPINTRKLYVLDSFGNLCPIGAPGELYIGGAGLALGYLNRPELTQERFVDNPFATEADKEKGYNKLYKTGDIVRWLPDGNLEYLGRNDFQVKIRGFRIELGEIESALADLPDVKQVVVIDRERDGNKYLAAYLVAEAGASIDEEQLRESLATSLPEYMVPSTFTFIDALPLTINGKLDRRALPEPEFVSGNTYVAPRNELEIQLCGIWQAVLGLEQVGVNDNFFRVGGDSIVSIQLVSRLRQAGFSLQVKTVFEAPTVAQLARVLQEAQTTTTVVSEQGQLQGRFELLPIQQWFFDNDLTNPHHFNQAFLINIPGDITSESIQTALVTLANQHDMLRCSFVATENGYQQAYQESVEPWMAPLQTQDISDLDETALQALLTEWQSDFNYEQGPLWQAAHLTGYPDGSARLFFAFHHLIIDAVSWRIIAQDMQTLLNGKSLATKSSSYRQWVQAVQRYADSHQTEATYWQEILDHQAPLPAPQEPQWSQVSLSAELTTALLREANQGYHTEINDLLLSALAIALRDSFDQPVNHITLEGHGRGAIDDTLDISHTVGWFTTTYPIELVAYDELSETIIQTKEMLRAIPSKGLGYGALWQARKLTGSLPAISFNYLGQLDNTSEDTSINWQLVGEDCGVWVATDNHDSLLLNINGAVQNGALQFGVVSQLSEKQLQQFTAAFEAALVNIIKHGQQIAEQGDVKTPSDYAAPELSIELLRQLQQRYDIEAIYPANSLQQGFIYHHLSQPQDDAYRVQVLLDYHQALNIEAYQQAWRLTSIRYPILRTAFNWEDNLLQIITAQPSITATNFTIKDISHLPSKERDAAIIDIQSQDRETPFDLTKPGLIRFTVIKQHDQLVTVLKTEHHSIVDGWSGPILWRTVHDYYDRIVKGEKPKIEQDTAYLDTQAYYLAQQQTIDAYWSKAKQRFEHANDINLMLSQAIDLNRAKTVEYSAEQTLTLQGEVYHKLKAVCQQLGVTLNVALQFAWHKLLHSYTQDEQTIVGTTVSGRDIPVPGVEFSVGLYINTLPLAVQWDNAKSIKEMLLTLQQSIADLNSHSGISLSKLQPHGERLFHTLLVFENYPMPVTNNDSYQKGIETGMNFQYALEKTDYPITVSAYEASNSLVVALKYGESWLNETQAQRLLSQLQRILEAISINPGQSHQTISLLDEQERHTLLHEWNQTNAPYPQDKTLHQLFEEQVVKTPNHIALMFEGEELTYQQLNQRANQLAHLIRERYQQRHQSPMPSDTLIGLYLDRSLEMVISILATLKAGGAYVPISPEYPKERSLFILEDTQAPILLTQQCFMEALNEWLPELPDAPDLLTADDVDFMVELPAINLEPISKPTDLAYVIYTSGTTGKPKGVMLPHFGVVNRIHWMQAQYPLGTSDKVLQKTPYTFDVSVWELLWANWVGAAIVMATPQIHKDPAALKALMEKEGITTVHFVPSMLSTFCQFLNESQLRLPASLRQVFCSGEALTPVHIKEFGNISHPCNALHNLYGPTEASIDVTYFDCSKFKSGLVPIGRAIDNTRLLVLNEQNQPVPIGAPGELYIGGAGLARGYLNRPELTQERFVDSPFATEIDKEKGYSKLYKTGDVVRWLPDGNLEYLGRNDFQVKIRGFRIELGEIESALANLPDVKQAVVIDREREGNKYLAAYLVIEPNASIDEEQLRESLATSLPEYMVPNTFTFIDALPLTINGKLDRRALPEPDFVSGNTYVAPRNELEIQLCSIWQTVLGLERVGIQDNLFQLGGNSILIITLASKINSAFKINLKIAKIFTAPTISELSKIVETERYHQGTITPIRPIPRNTPIPLSFEEANYYKLELKGIKENMQYIHELYGKLDKKSLLNAIYEIVNRHEELRTTFSEKDGQLYRIIHKERQNDVNQISLREKDKKYQKKILKDQIQADYKLVNSLVGPTFHISLLQLSELEHALLITASHAIYDGWSEGNFRKELTELYTAYSSETKPQLKPLTIQYADYAYWQRHNLQGKYLEELQQYWSKKISDFPPRLSLPTTADQSNAKLKKYKYVGIPFEISQKTTKILTNIANHKRTTFHTLLLTIMKIFLALYTNKKDIMISVPSATRTLETNNLIGGFITGKFVISKIEQNLNFYEILDIVKENSIDDELASYIPITWIGELMENYHVYSNTQFLQFSFNMVPNSKSLDIPNIKSHSKLIAQNTDYFDFDLWLIINVSEDYEDKIYSGSLFCNPNRYNEISAKTIVNNIFYLIDFLTENPTLPIHKINLS